MAEKRYCDYCGGEVVNEEELLEFVKDSNSGETVYFHKKCAEQRGLDSPEKIEQYFGKTRSVESISPNILLEEKLINVLRIIGWANLALGVIGAFIIWNKLGIVEKHYYLPNEYNPFGITLSIVSLIEGIVGWALLLVVSFTAENVITIKKHLQIK